MIPLLANGHPNSVTGQAARRSLLLHLATTRGPCDLLCEPDNVGAYVMHALVVNNSEESLDLARAIFQARRTRSDHLCRPT